MRIDREIFKKAFSSNPFEIFSRMIETDSGKIAYKRTRHVLRVSLFIYIPLVIICVVLFAFWDGQSRGTKHMIDLAKRYGLEIHVVNYKEKLNE